MFVQHLLRCPEASLLYQVHAQSSARSDYAEAARLIQDGLNKVGSDQGLSKSYEVYIHNSVVTLARNERYEEALSLLDEALSLLPNSSVLQQDRSKVLGRKPRRLLPAANPPPREREAQ